MLIGQMPALRVAAPVLTSGKCLHTAASGKSLDANGSLGLLAGDAQRACPLLTPLQMPHVFPQKQGQPSAAVPVSTVASLAGEDVARQAASL